LVSKPNHNCSTERALASSEFCRSSRNTVLIEAVGSIRTARVDKCRGIEGKDSAWVNQIGEEQVNAMVECVLDLVITEKGISGAPLRLCRVLIVDCSPTSNRLCAVLLRQGERLCAPTRKQVKQQPDRAGSRCHDREPCRGPTSVRRQIASEFSDPISPPRISVHNKAANTTIAAQNHPHTKIEKKINSAERARRA
jgi:hypothetical protein